MRFWNASTPPEPGTEASGWIAPPLSQLALPVGAVHLWAARLDLPPGQRVELTATLSPDELARVARFHFARDRQRWIAALQSGLSLLSFCFRVRRRSTPKSERLCRGFSPTSGRS